MSRHGGTAVSSLVDLFEVLDDFEGVEIGVVNFDLDLHAGPLRLLLRHDGNVLEGDQLLALLHALMLVFNCLGHYRLAIGRGIRALRTWLEPRGWPVASRKGGAATEVRGPAASEGRAALRELVLALGGQEAQCRQHEAL